MHVDEVRDLLGDECPAGAMFDVADGRYRYRLWRTWDRSRFPAVFCCLNPSTATAFEDDPTVRRLVGFAKAWDRGGIVLVNLYALRATDPAELAKAEDPVGSSNDQAIRDIDAVEVVAAWGSHPMAAKRAAAVAALIKAPLVCLGTNKDGMPRHPLYLPYTAARVPWTPPG